MIIGYLVSFFRHLKRHWTLAFLNILSYGTGIAACLLILQYISYETSYDGFYKNYESIYRVQLDHFYSDVEQNSTALSYYPLGQTLAKEYPQVKTFTRMRKMRSATVTVGENVFLEDDAFLVDSTFFKVFPIKMVKGSDQMSKVCVFISESMAAKYFDQVNPIGEVMWIDFRKLPVNGVFKDIPDNSHMKYDLLVVHPNRSAANDWYYTNYYTYITLSEDPELFSEQLKKFSEKFSQVADKQSENEYSFRAKLQPLTSIHLESNLQNEHESNGNIQDVYILFAVMVMILLISCFNYVNMTNAINADRAKELFVRKIHGSSERDSLVQHVAESFVLNILGFGVAVLVLIIFVQWIGPQFDFGELNINWSNATSYYVLVGMFVLSFILSGILPAVLSSSSNLAQLLNTMSSSSSSGRRFSRNMAITQFVISYILISGALVVTKQLDFMNEQDAGFDPTGVVALTLKPAPYRRFQNNFKKLKDDLEKQTWIKHVSFSNVIPGEHLWRDGSSRFSDESTENSKSCMLQTVSPNYFETYGIEIILGRGFSENRSSDLNTVVVNESLAKKLNVKDLESIIGRKITLPYNNEFPEFEVIGVVKDYFHESMKLDKKPIVYVPIRNNAFCAKISVKIDQGREKNWREDVDFIKNTYSENFKEALAKVNLNVAAMVKDVEVEYKGQYSNDIKFSNLMGVLAFLAVLMSGIGFFSLASTTTRKRTREIAIRKINGARIADVTLLLMTYFLKLIGLAFIISLPISYFLVQDWLNDFPIRTDIGPWFIFWPILITAILSVISVAYHISKVVFLNPVHVLRTE